jgi:hypothetical protein
MGKPDLPKARCLRCKARILVGEARAAHTALNADDSETKGVAHVSDLACERAVERQADAQRGYPAPPKSDGCGRCDASRTAAASDPEGGRVDGRDVAVDSERA